MKQTNVLSKTHQLQFNTEEERVKKIIDYSEKLEELEKLTELKRIKIVPNLACRML